MRTLNFFFQFSQAVKGSFKPCTFRPWNPTLNPKIINIIIQSKQTKASRTPERCALSISIFVVSEPGCWREDVVDPMEDAQRSFDLVFLPVSWNSLMLPKVANLLVVRKAITTTGNDPCPTWTKKQCDAQVYLYGYQDSDPTYVKIELRATEVRWHEKMPILLVAISQLTCEMFLHGERV